jgi:hypothetical protein
MERLSTYLLTIVVTGVATAIFAPMALHRTYVVADNVNNQTNAAFRDGLFLARFDAEHGRKLHLMSGRWSTDADRRLFVAAYLQAYREMRVDPTPEQLGSSQSAAKRGYRDGLADGLQQRYESRSFQPTAAENYRRADRGYSNSSGDMNQYKQAYREAYCNGYQTAFYGKTAQIERLTPVSEAPTHAEGGDSSKPPPRVYE